MKKVLSQASSFGAPAGSNLDALNEAIKNGWVKYAGYGQNSMTARYNITEEGAAVLAA